MADELILQSEPVAPETAQKVQAAMGAANEANLTAMLALKAELDAQTMRGEDGRMHGPMQPCTIINLNPSRVTIGGGMKLSIPPYDWDGKEGKNKKVFSRGGRMHVGHVVTDHLGQQWLSPGGHTEYLDVGWAQPTLTPRHMSPAMRCWHLWREYMTASGSAQLMGGVLIFDGDIHELDKARLEKNKGHILVPEGYPIPKGKGRYAIRYVRRDFSEVLNQAVELQKNFLNRFAQTAFELFNSKEEGARKQITEPMRRWGLFGVEVGYLKDTAPWMMELPDASASAEAMKSCPVCRETTTNAELLLCPKDGAPYNADCTVEAMKRGFPVAESFIDALDEPHYKEVLETIRMQVARRAERLKLTGAKASEGAK